MAIIEAVEPRLLFLPAGTKQDRSRGDLHETSHRALLRHRGIPRRELDPGRRGRQAGILKSGRAPDAHALAYRRATSYQRRCFIQFRPRRPGRTDLPAARSSLGCAPSRAWTTFPPGDQRDGARDEVGERECSETAAVRLNVEPAEVVLDWSPTPTGPDACARRTRQLSATAQLGDGSMLDVTSTCEWWSSNPSAVGVTAWPGLIQAVGAGEADVVASYGCVESNVVGVHVNYCTGP